MRERQPNSGGSEGDRTDADGESARPGEGSLRADGGRDLGEYMDALAHPRRRAVLYCLRGQEGAEFGDLAAGVISREAGAAERVDEETRQSVRIELHHTHLPKLEDAGILSYDWERGTLRYHSPELVEQLLDLCASTEAPEATEE